MAAVGRRRTRDLDLPPLVYRKGGRFYYGREGLALGGDFGEMLKRYAELRTGVPAVGSFLDAVNAYRLKELPKKAPKTRKEYERQLTTLTKAFGHFDLDEIEPVSVQEYLDGRPRIAGTREKALLSALLNFARSRGLTSIPNPCAGIKGHKAVRTQYVSDADLAAVLKHSEPVLAAFLEICYRTGADPSVVLALRRSDVRDGALHVRRSKTGIAVRINLVGPLKPLLEGLRTDSPDLRSVYLLADKRGQPYQLQAMRKRFWKARKAAGAAWQIRDMRSKAATDSDSLKAANVLLAHSSEATTAVYRRRRQGETAQPITKDLKE